MSATGFSSQDLSSQMSPKEVFEHVFALTLSILRIVYMSMFLTLYSVDKPIEISETNRKSILGMVSVDLGLAIFYLVRSLVNGKFFPIPFILYSISVSSWMIHVVSRTNVNDPSLRTSIKILRGFTYFHISFPILHVVVFSLVATYSAYVGTKAGLQTFGKIVKKP